MPDEQQTLEIEKSQVTIPAPGLPTRFIALGPDKTGKSGPLLALTKQNQYGIYYEMFRQHPILRGAIEKISKYAVTTGFKFVSPDPNTEPNSERVTALQKFFRRSNAQHLLRMTYKDLLIYGETFWLIEKTVLGSTPVRAMRLHPKFMSPDLDANDNIIRWVYGPGITEDAKVYDLNRIVHFKLDDPDTDLQGLSPLHSLQLTVTSDLNAMHFNGNFFENSAQTGVVFIVKQATADEAKRNREWLEQEYVGVKNAHRPLLLEGDVDVKSSVNRQTDMQYVEGRILNRQEIMTVLDVPPDKLQIVEDFRRNADQGGRGFHEETIKPLQVIVEEEISNTLIWQIFGWADVLFKHAEADSESELDEAKLNKEYQNMGVLSVNQIARSRGLPDVKDGDGHFIQTAAGMIPVSLLDEVAGRLIANGQALPDPISGLGTTTTGVRNPSKSDAKPAGVQDGRSSS